MVKKSILLLLATNRYRYAFIGIIFGALLIGLMLTAYTINNQLNRVEQNAAVRSVNLPLKERPDSLVNIPYHTLQKISLKLFDATIPAIKLPSLLIAVVVGVGLVFLLRRWLMRPSIALITSLIAITNVQFLYLASTGTPSIMLLFWPLCLFLVGLKLVRFKKSALWALLVATLVGLSVYTPFMIYILLAMLILAIWHPRLRLLLKTMPRKYLFAGIGIVAILWLPLAFYPQDIGILAGKSEQVMTLGNLRHNAAEVIKSFVVFWYPTMTPYGIRPIFNIAVLLLILFGILRLMYDAHSARSYGLLVLVPILLLVTILNPTVLPILFIPFILLLAIGIEGFLNEWYKLFPFNPYARVIALMPLSLLLISIVISNITIFQTTYSYNPVVAQYYTRDLSLIRPLLERYPTAVIATTNYQRPLYNILKKDFPGSDTSLGYIRDSGRVTIVTTGTGLAIDKNTVPSYIVTDHYSMREPRFYVFTNK